MERDDGSTEPLLRTLTQGDLARLVAIDTQHTGRRRGAWYEKRLERALLHSGVRISLGAEVDGTLVGALLGEVHYGEFGLVEPVAVLDTILVDRAFTRQHIGAALLDQLSRNLQLLNIERIRTEVDWGQQDMLGFLARRGFAPAPRLVLERTIR